MYCGSTKISELCIELQNSLMLNPQVGEERSVVLCAYSNSVFMEPKIEECLKSILTIIFVQVHMQLPYFTM